MHVMEIIALIFKEQVSWGGPISMLSVEVGKGAGGLAGEDGRGG